MLIVRVSISYQNIKLLKKLLYIRLNVSRDSIFIKISNRRRKFDLKKRIM